MELNNGASIVSELKKLKEVIFYVHKNKSIIINEFGSLDSYYDGYIKSKFPESFPLLFDYIKKASGDITPDDFAKKMITGSKEEVLDLFEGFTTSISSEPSSITMSKRTDKRVQDANRILEFLEKSNSLDYFSNMFKLFNDYYKYYDSVPLKKETKIPIKGEDIIAVTRKIVEDIDPSLTEQFDNFAKDKSIKHTKLRSTNYQSHEGIGKVKKKRNFSIRLQNKNTIHDIYSLIHEFFHHVSDPYAWSNSDKDIADVYDDHTRFTEFISIFFEYYAINYLKERFNIPDEDFYNNMRLVSSRKEAKDNYITLLPVAIYKEYGTFNYETFVEYINKNELLLKPTKANYQMVAFEFSDDFGECLDEDIMNANEEEIDNFRYQFIADYEEDKNHLLGTLLYLKTKDKISKRDVLRLAELFRKAKVDEIDSDSVFEMFTAEYDNMIEDGLTEKELAGMTEKKGRTI